MKNSKRSQAVAWYLAGNGTQVKAAELFGIKQSTVSQGVKAYRVKMAKLLNKGV
jgi:predicted DNA-binding protein (UPF0251 family)